MPRKTRIHYPGATYHVILRGNAGAPIFFEDNDRYRLYLFLQQASERFRCRIHGFCLMTNHIHLLVQVADIPLSTIMQNLSLRYTKWINFSQNRTGHVFQGRYKALLLDADAYLLELVRYIHLNPVRAGMVAAPELYPWSGHRAYLGRETIPWLTTDWILSQLSSGTDTARQAYGEFVQQGMGGGREAQYHHGTAEGFILGEDRFADNVLQLANSHRPPNYSMEDVVKAVCQSYGVTLAQLQAPGKRRPFNEARALAALIIGESPHLSLTELGRLMDRTVGPLGRAARLFSRKASNDARLRELKTEALKRLGMAESQT